MSQETIHPESIRTAVRERYGAIARGEGDACCGPSCCGQTAETTAALDLGYTAEELAAIPEEANLGLGSGNPIGAADLQPGEVVLDLGAGAGIDVFLASGRVGPKGKAIGVDMTPDMVEKARGNALKGGFTNVEFRLGEIEALPVADAGVDAIVSNCVLNLSTRRQQAFQEAFRVLRPGGRLVVSDLLAGAPVPEVLNRFPDVISGCLPVPRQDYVGGLEAAGFVDVEVLHERPFSAERLPVNPGVIERIEEAGESVDAVLAFAGSAASAIVRARKPAG